MTICYTAEVATCTGFSCFLKLLKRWRGSIYKLVWMDLLAFLCLYYTLSYIYRYALDEAQMHMFEDMVSYCNNYGSLIPLSFVLGFYVSIVMTRWWNQYITIPWPDPIAVYVSSLVHGHDERGRVMRRTVMRYVCLCLTMVLISMSPRVKKRFPTHDHLIDAGLLLENEKKVLKNFDQRFPKHSKHWMPIVWSSSIIKRARKEGRIRDDFAVKTIIDELNKFRGNCGLLTHYDVISIPLVYTQVVTLAVYSYFLCSLMGKQWTRRPDAEGYLNMVDKYFPIFTTLEFFFYVGWLKVAETLINPFGNDDDDFEVNWLIDRNLQVSYLIVDEMHHEHPELIKDQYWDEVLPNKLPYANEQHGKREEPPEPSTAKIDLTKTGGGLSSIRIDGCHITSHHSSVMRLNSAFRGLLGCQDGARSGTCIHPRSSNTSSYLSLASSKHASSTLVAIVKPSPKQVTLRSPPSEIIRSIALNEEQEESSESLTLVNQPAQQQSHDVREIFRQTPSAIYGQSTSGDSLHSRADAERAKNQSMDDFDRLKEERAKLRIQRQKENIVRTVGNVEEMAASLPLSSLQNLPSILSRPASTTQVDSKSSTQISSQTKKTEPPKPQDRKDDEPKPDSESKS